MIEILVVYWLCKRNAQTALINGHRPISYIIITAALWFCMEAGGLIIAGLVIKAENPSDVFIRLTAIIAGIIIAWFIRNNWSESGKSGNRYVRYIIIAGLWFGLQISWLVFGFFTSILTLFFIAIGGYISHYIVNSLNPGKYIMNVKAEPLTGSAQITIVRENNPTCSSVGWNFFLNGKDLGRIEDSESITVTTNQKNNALVARMDCGVLSLPYVFAAESGGHFEMRFWRCGFENMMGAETLSSTSAGQSVVQSAP